MKKKMDNKGFSLVELIIVIAIMVILVAVLAPQYLKYVEKSRVATDVQTTVEFINSLQVLASDPDVDLSGGTYTVKNNKTADLTISDDLHDKLIAAGMLTANDFTGAAGGWKSTSKYQSTGYTGADITLKLEYVNVDPADASKGKVWSVTTGGVDSSGKLPTPASP